MATVAIERLRIAALVAVVLVAAAIGLELVRPLVAGPVGFDSAASVIHFDRIAAGRHLESFVTATPKPLLTVVYGALVALTGDWRAVSLATIAAFAGCVSLGAWLAFRLGGPVAAAFAVIGLIESRALLGDVAISYAVPWALLLWLVAGLAVTASRPRPLIAGLTLGAAVLARLETLALVGLIAALLLAAWAVGRRRGRPIDRSWWLLLSAFLAIPIMLVHDYLLTGDPFFWMTVSARYSAAAPDSVLTPVELVRVLVVHVRSMALVAALAAVGFVDLAVRRSWPSLVGLAGLTAGVAGLLEVLALRGTYVSSRYFAAIDVSLVLTAAVGLAAIVSLAGRLWRWGVRPRATLIVAVGVAGIVALAAMRPLPTIQASFRTTIDGQLLQAEHADRVLPVLRCALARIPGAGTFPDQAASLIATSPEQLVVLVPTLARPRFVHDLGLPLYQVGGLPVTWATPGAGFLPGGAVVFHDRLGDRPDGSYGALEVDAVTQVGAVTLRPLIADRAAGVWVLAITRTPSGPDLGSCAELR